MGILGMKETFGGKRAFPDEPYFSDDGRHRLDLHPRTLPPTYLTAEGAFHGAVRDRSGGDKTDSEIPVIRGK